MDGDAAKDILVKNTSTYNVKISQEGNPSLSGKMSSYTEEQYIISHPNTLWFELELGESQRGVMTIAFGNNLRDLSQNITN